ncbi:unhealthy ribosome biogenesis protein 2 homolog isoform X2 [Oculina patagonica]
MKSSSKGIYSKLKDPAVAWDEKLSLAKHAWDSSDCVIPNKQQVLLDWIVQEIINGYKKGVKEANYEMLNGLWEFLLHVIQSQELFTEGKISITLKPQLLQVFKDIFLCKDSVQIGSSISAIISCCNTVFSTPQLAASVLAKFESYVSFLSAFLSYFVPICLEESKEFYLLVKVCLEKYFLVQRQQANQRKVFTSMCQQLLEPLVSLHHKFKSTSKLSHSTVEQHGDLPENWQVKKAQDIRNLVELAVTRSLFHKDHMSEYPLALKVREEKPTDSDVPATKRPRISSYPKLLFDKLWEMTDPVTKVNITATKEAALEILPFLYKEFINSSRKQNPSTSAVDFDFFTEICQMMGILKDRGRHITSSVFTLLHQLLECILIHDIYQVSDDSLNGSVHFDCFKNIVEVLIQTDVPGEAVFWCLEDLLKLNHSLLEPHLEIIWTMLWKTTSVTVVAQNSLVSSLISTYVKLRQFEKLVLAILVSIRTLDVPTLGGLTPLFNQRFTKAIQGLPFGQITSIWNIFCDEIVENYLTKISPSTEAGLVKKKKKSSPQLPAMWSSLEHVTSIFSAFLVNISFGGIGEQLKRKTSMSSVGELLRRTVTDVVDPLFEMSSKVVHETEKESACFSTLLLQHALGELELFLKKFKIVEEDSEATKILPSIMWIDEISDFAPAKMSKELISILCKDRERLCFLKAALCIQNIRSVLLKNKELDQVAKGSKLKRLVSSVCHSVSDNAECSASWDKQERSISEENAPVALWDLISRHAVVLLPLCTADQQLQVAHLLIKTISEDSQVAGHAQPGCITMIDVSLEMIHSTGFQEILAMQSSTVCALWGHLKQAIDSKCCDSSLGERLIKALSDIAMQEYSNIGTVEETPGYGATINDDDGLDAGSEHDAEESSDEDIDDHEDDEHMEEETQTTDKECVGNLQAFRSLGCDITDISKSILFTDAAINNLSSSAAECYQLLKILGFLPLDWLSDDNHIRCLIGLFSCDVLLNSNIFQECSADLLKPLSLSRQLLTVLFDGCVTRRRFIAHHVIDFEALHAWLIGSASKLWRHFDTDEASVSDMNVMLRDTRGLLFSTFKYLLKAPSQTAYAGQSTIQKLKEDLETFSSEVQQCSKDSLKKTMSSHHAVSVIVEGLLALCEEVFSNKTSSSKMIRISSDVVIKLGPALLELLRSIVRVSQRKQKGEKAGDGDKSRLHDILCQFSVLIDSFTSVLHIYAVAEQSRKLMRVKEVYKVCNWQDVFDVTLTAVIHRLFERDLTHSPENENEVGTLHSCLRFLKVVCLSCSKLELHLPDDFHIRLLASTLHFLRLLELSKNNSAEAPKNDCLHLEKENVGHQSKRTEMQMEREGKCLGKVDIVEEGYCLVVSLLQGCDPVLLPELLEGLGDEITTKNCSDASLERLRVALHVWHRLLSGRFTKDRKKELRPKLPKILFALQFVLQQFKTDNLGIVNLATDVMVKIISLGKGMVLPHNALLVLHSNLNKLAANNRSFPPLFQSQYSLLSTLLFQHSEAVYGAVHVFVTCVRDLLLSLIQSCDEQSKDAVEQDGSQKTGKLFKPSELSQSVQKMARLYQEISTHKNAFSKYSPYMIADYIHAIQTVAVPSVIRDALVPGVYCLLDLCGEHELSLLHAVLEKGSRELFHSLHADYTKYHKFKGKV